ncbi:MAG: hypothetical protein JNJ54_14790 [Myxococcaceae bacterium]|nr:hypothetical protein [Myxococcaceae bacterium]
MRWLLLVPALSGCPKVAPCEPWKGWELTALSDAPGERLEACSPSLLRWRVVSGGVPGAWLGQLEAMTPDGGWRLWRRTALVRPATVGVRVEVVPSRQDLVISLTPDPTIDVDQALADLRPPASR